ncbi:hypothetical protein B484DRAFT_478596 [Ochromonadaceae sp. CCMP2298]|nr:hypothetical protein B484DRAFT_478596 [Ochromonadaceae sp. CCMP2298]|mmetsp:Transcript_16942/g.37670  ORF Transcript_16942/g.37670 Transcript_16942/m.37670 type:complete len:596 (-) Transcript_16942:569-2356(-)
MASQSSTDTMDTRLFTKEAISLMKSGNAVDKTLKWTIRQTLRSEYDPELSLGEESSASGAYPKANNNKLESSWSTPSLRTRSAKQVSAKLNSFSSNRDPAFEKRKRYSFSMFAKRIPDVDPAHSRGEDDDWHIPVASIDEAVELLSEISGIDLVKEMDPKHHFRLNPAISYTKFSSFIDAVFQVRNGTPLGDKTRSNSLTAAPLSLQPPEPFQNPIKRADSTQSVGMTQWDPVKSRHDPVTPDNVRLRGTIVPTAFLKDAMIKVFREEGLQSSRLINKGYSRFSTSQITDDISMTSKSMGEKTVGRGASQLLKATQGQLISQLVDPEEDYNYKWKKMKHARDDGRKGLENRKNRDEMLLNFKKVVISTERSDFHRAYKEKYNHDQYVQRRRYLGAAQEQRTLKERMQSINAQKRQQINKEVKFMKSMLQESASKSRSLQHEELLSQRIDRIGSTGSQYDIHSCPSSQVLIPEELLQKVKAARSLNAYEAAKKEVKDYHEQVLSDRINVFAKFRDHSIQLAGDKVIDARITLTPMLASELFEETFNDSTTSIAHSTVHGSTVKPFRQRLDGLDFGNMSLQSNMPDDPGSMWRTGSS